MKHQIVDKVKVKIHALRPVLIGSGRKGRVSLDTVEVNGRMYYVRPEAFIDQYLEQSSTPQVMHLRGYDFKKLVQRELQLALAKGGVPTWAQRVDTPLYGSDIHFQFCHPVDGYPILPGSSVKGALRTILMCMLGYTKLRDIARKGNGPKQNSSTRSAYLKHLEKKIGAKQDLADKYVGRFENALTRHVRIPDVALGEKAEWWNVKILGDVGNRHLKWKNKKKNGYTFKFIKNKFVSVVTAIPKGATQTCEWGLELEAILENQQCRSAFLENENWKKEIRSEHPTDAFGFYKELFCYMRRYMRHYLMEEIRFFSCCQSQTSRKKQLIEKIREACENEKKNWPSRADYDRQINMLEDLCTLYRELDRMDRHDLPACLLRLGWGSGFHAMTGDWQYASHLDPLHHSGLVRMKTRKVFFKKGEEDFALPGFVKVELCA